jgi:hypothetical protein
VNAAGYQAKLAPDESCKPTAKGFSPNGRSTGMGLKIGLWAAAAAICAVRAQGGMDEPTLPDKAAIQQLLEELQNLRARVQSLEAKLGPSPSIVEKPVTSQTVAGSTLPHQDMPEMAPAQPEDAHSQHSFLTSPLLSFHGYADLGYRAVTSAGGTSSFRLGQADLFLTSKLSDKLSFLMETAIDWDQNNSPEIEIERIFLTYRQNEYFNVDVGRYHTALGYFNGAFHHGRWFQTAEDRPFLFWFEDDGGLLPIHNVGVSVSGRIPSGALNLHYVAEIGNGRASRSPGSEAVQPVRDENNGKSLNLALYANPSSLPGWQFGASIYRDRLTPDGGPKIEQRIYTAHAIYVRDRFEFLNEGVLMHHRAALPGGGGRVTTVPGFYSQIAYRIVPSGRPYFRFEFMNPAASDPVVSGLMGTSGFRRAYTAGYRFDIAEFCALKFQIERVSRRDLRPSTEGSAQLSFAF